MTLGEAKNIINNDYYSASEDEYLEAMTVYFKEEFNVDVKNND